MSGTLCERCRVRIKKRQAKTKQRFRLEPRKSVLGSNVGGRHGVDDELKEVETMVDGTGDSDES